MVRALFYCLSLWLGAACASAEALDSSKDCDTRCVIEAIWQNSEAIEPSKREHIIPLFLETVAHVAPEYEDYALKKVRKFVSAEGWDAFFARSQSRSFPFNSGRPEMMAAAAEHLADDELADRIYTLMERLGFEDRSEAGFERASFGHVLVEAAMRRCDLQSFDRVLKMTDAPESIRYAFWRTRMAGCPSDLAPRISRDFDPESTTLLRQAMDGYGDVLRHGVCEINEEKQAEHR